MELKNVFIDANEDVFLQYESKSFLSIAIETEFGLYI